MLDLHIVVAEVDWSTCELLAIQCYIYRVLQLIWVKIDQVWDLSDDFSIFIVTLRSDPIFAFISGSVCTTGHFRAATLSSLTSD